MQISLSGRTAIVTGAAGGIGAGIAAGLTAAGARVACVDIRKPGPEARHAAHYVADVTDETAVLDTVRCVAADIAPPDILVNNAGISRPGPTAHTDLPDWEDVIRVNLTAAFLWTKHVGPAMAAHGYGRIINIASLNALTAPLFGDNASYAAAKSGLIGLTRNSAIELAASGVTVNAVAPGVVDTTLLRNSHPPERLAALRSRIPVGRFTTVEEVASVVTFLASGLTGSVTGTTFNITGGLHVG